MRVTILSFFLIPFFLFAAEVKSYDFVVANFPKLIENKGWHNWAKILMRKQLISQNIKTKARAQCHKIVSNGVAYWQIERPIALIFNVYSRIGYQILHLIDK